MLGVHAAHFDHHLLRAPVVTVEAELSTAPGEAVVDRHPVLINLALGRATAMNLHRRASIASVSHVLDGLAGHDDGGGHRGHVHERLPDGNIVQNLTRHGRFLNDVLHVNRGRLT